MKIDPYFPLGTQLRTTQGEFPIIGYAICDIINGMRSKVSDKYIIQYVIDSADPTLAGMVTTFQFAYPFRAANWIREKFGDHTPIYRLKSGILIKQNDTAYRT